MTHFPEELEHFDWSRTTFAGARREQMRWWASLTVEEMLDAIEAMGDLFSAPAIPLKGRTADP